jgi:phage head maturation protease
MNDEETVQALVWAGFETDSVLKAVRTGDLGFVERIAPGAFTRTIQERDLTEFGPVTWPVYDEENGADTS